MKVAVVGATGMVGSEMLKQLEERDFPISNLLPIASEKSAGKLINFKNNSIPVIGIESSLDVRADIALFSAGSERRTARAATLFSKGFYFRGTLYRFCRAILRTAV